MSEALAPSSMVPSSTAAPQAAEATEQKPLDLGTPQKEAPKVEEKKDELDYSSRFAALSRREKQLIERERKLKEIESQYKDKDSNYKSWEEKKQLFKQNPDAMLEEIGLSFDELINRKLGLDQSAEEQNTPDALYKKLKADLQAEIEAKEKAREEAEMKRRQELEEQENAQVIESFKSDMVDTIKKNADKYELINYQGNYDLVFDVIQQYFDEHEEVLQVEQAADHVESYLESLVEGATKLKKIQSKLAPKVELSQPTESAPKTNQAQEQMPKTLSNTLNAQSSSIGEAPLSLEESKKRAAALLRWS
jgi:hypothetical protein